MRDRNLATQLFHELQDVLDIPTKEERRQVLANRLESFQESLRTTLSQLDLQDAAVVAAVLRLPMYEVLVAYQTADSLIRHKPQQYMNLAEAEGTFANEELNFREKRHPAAASARAYSIKLRGPGIEEREASEGTFSSYE